MQHTILKFDTIDSTQDEAKRIASFVETGTVIFAKRQRKGRGKPGNLWFSPDGGLYFSLILKSDKDVNDLLFVTKSTAKVVVLVLLEYGLSAEIKLPNDVLVSGRKICGILAEKTKEALIIGVGVNLNTIDFPVGLNATSIKLLAKDKIDPDEFLGRFLKIFDEKIENETGIK
ncbi:biotin--[acetyl-CoA-carboxylase] ligase [candidate division WOR-1 bacterium RIFOXYC2_FULL_37_10]|uniref:Biotin--[acetyl-CoA-carboxylase] ligase n=1 Tax=candidate division WOR-1 bacterium RIFOXYB2_FULL_37_13 TaxID=1802579 RepID=A0A1F4SWY8_UNCSA|nr:MAG: biotin--[acetyl-CoA-carboxylase] ligase [candidate division WOR-1 bacterium RIFOXYB2_FULL_37_13]OGC32407.1 MAG: biotin--[acetyl-CoA-carboxylase] ligase [candidate division WOR-1 bacterium RIFOXYC2_FULL_37_10]